MKYTKQLTNVEEFVPVLVIKPNPAWVNQHGWLAYTNAMNTFATFNLPPNRRRDDNSQCIFHFKDLQELYGVRDTISTQNIIPNAFAVPSTLAPFHSTLQQHPIGYAYILMKLGVCQTDFSEDKRFFNLS